MTGEQISQRVPPQFRVFWLQGSRWRAVSCLAVSWLEGKQPPAARGAHRGGKGQGATHSRTVKVRRKLKQHLATGSAGQALAGDPARTSDSSTDTTQGFDRREAW